MIALLLALIQAAPAPQPDAEPAAPTPVAEAEMTAELQDVASADDGVLLAPVKWEADLPQAGTLVKLRVRGSALVEIIEAGSDWSVTMDGKAQPARTIWPVQAPVVPETDLEYTSADVGGKLIATIDLGESPQQLNELLLEFTNQEITAKVTIATSRDGDQYSDYSVPQLVYQRITPNGIVRLNSIRCNPQDNRYLKLQITSNSEAKLVSISARNAVEDLNDTYEIAARFGAPLSDPETHGRLLPLELASNMLPISMLRLTAASSIDPIPLGIARLSPAGGVKRTVAEGVWGGKFEAFNISRDASRLACYDPNSGEEPWAVVLHADNLPQLDFSEVRAWAAEVYIVTYMPEGDKQIGLKLHDQPGSSPAMQAVTVAALRDIPLAGEFNAVQSPPPPLGLTGPSAQIVEQLTVESMRYKYVLGYGLLGITCVVVGLVLLRRRSSTAKYEN